MRITFLGTNGWYDTNTGNTTCILVETDSCYIIFDAGNGIYKLDQYIKDNRPIYLLLSHLHLDHVCGLHILNKFNFSQGINVCINEGDRGHLEALISIPYTLPFSSLPYPVKVLEIPKESGDLPFSLECKFLKHSVSTLGFRISVEGKVIAYCPDTGYCEEALNLARSSDLLIAECGYLPGEKHECWPHLNPETAADLALKAGAKRLALVHFDASRYVTIEDREKAETEAEKIFPAMFAAKDGEEMRL